MLRRYSSTNRRKYFYDLSKVSNISQGFGASFHGSVISFGGHQRHRGGRGDLTVRGLAAGTIPTGSWPACVRWAYGPSLISATGQ